MRPEYVKDGVHRRTKSKKTGFSAIIVLFVTNRILADYGSFPQ